MYIGKRDNFQPGARRLGPMKRNRSIRSGGRLNFFHAFNLLQLALGLGSLGGLGAEAVGKPLESFDFLPLVLISRPLLFLAHGTLGHIGIVIAAVADNTRLGNFKNTADQLIEQFAVVGDHQDGTGIGPQIILEPDQRFDIQMVGRFIQHQQAGFLHQQARQVGTHDPPAAERAHRPLEIRLAEGQPGQDPLGFRFQFVETPFIQPLLGGMPCIAVRRLRAQGIAQGRDFRRNRCSQFKDCFVATGLDFLGKVPHRHTVPESHRAFVRFQVAQNKTKQGGLTRPVWSNHPDPVRRLHMKRHATEQGALTV